MPTPVATANAAYSEAVAATDVNGDALTITLQNAPAWLTLVDHGDGTATLGGTPGVGDIGQARFQLVVSDGGFSSTENVTIPVLGNLAAPTIRTRRLPVPQSGRPFRATITTHDPDGNSLAFSARDLPAWLTLVDNGDSTAGLVGTPPIDPFGNTTGSFFKLTATDGTFSDTRTFGVEAKPDPVTLLDDGTLVVVGAGEADDIHVWRRGDDRVRVVINGTTANFAAIAVTAVHVRGFVGDDVLTINTGFVPVDVDGGQADDTIVGSDGNDTLRGSDGDDRILGQSGDDVIDGGRGQDTLHGDAGDDSLLGGAADDVLFGGDGQDTLSGGDGRDTLRGEAGRDLFLSRDGNADRLFAGPAGQNDRATIDRKDRFPDGVIELL